MYYVLERLQDIYGKNGIKLIISTYEMTIKEFYTATDVEELG
ncbi:MAG: hypothetical protein ACLTH0_01505 [Blautia producta]